MFRVVEEPVGYVCLRRGDSDEKEMWNRDDGRMVTF